MFLSKINYNIGIQEKKIEKSALQGKELCLKNNYI